jgi:acetylornithine deacetylase
VGYATDAGWLQSLGMQCVLFGPGSIRVAHKPDEHVPISHLARGHQVLAALCHRCCVETTDVAVRA